MPKYFAASSIVKRLFMALQTALSFMPDAFSRVSLPTAPHTSWSGTYERVQNYSPYRKGRGGAQRWSVGRVSAEGALAYGASSFGSQASEAPRPETPCQVDSGTVVSRDATRPCQENSHGLLRGVARPWQLRHRRRRHVCSRPWTQTGEILLRLRVGEGGNTMLRRSRCASLLCGVVRNRSSSPLSQAGG